MHLFEQSVVGVGMAVADRIGLGGSETQECIVHGPAAGWRGGGV